MKTCIGCKYADWDKTKSGKLHPSGMGQCRYPYEIPPLPQSRYWIGAPCPAGGWIDRREQLKDHCLYYQPDITDGIKWLKKVGI